MSLVFESFGKIGRLSREVIITEKIDGTNAQIIIGEDGEFATASRTRLITPTDDNYGFSKWAHDHKDELMQMGPGRHFGEWWGQGIQRNYSQPAKRFSLFKVSRWGEGGKDADKKPACVGVVPLLWRGDFDTNAIKGVMHTLEKGGSIAAPGFMKPEGIVIYHTANGVLFKKTIEDDDKGKGKDGIEKRKPVNKGE